MGYNNTATLLCLGHAVCSLAVECPCCVNTHPIDLCCFQSLTCVCECDLLSYVQVCLSLLGTWHGTDASQKWDPQNSSLFQILLSIQGMILISDPYFNEPNVERMRGQTEGTKASNSYNAEIHLNNIRSGFSLCTCLLCTGDNLYGINRNA